MTTCYNLHRKSPGSGPITNNLASEIDQLSLMVEAITWYCFKEDGIGLNWLTADGAQADDLLTPALLPHSAGHCSDKLLGGSTNALLDLLRALRFAASTVAGAEMVATGKPYEDETRPAKTAETHSAVVIDYGSGVCAVSAACAGSAAVALICLATAQGTSTNLALTITMLDTATLTAHRKVASFGQITVQAKRTASVSDLGNGFSFLEREGNIWVATLHAISDNPGPGMQISLLQLAGHTCTQVSPLLPDCPMEGLAFVNGNTLATAGDAGTAEIWRLNSETGTCLFHRILPRPSFKVGMYMGVCKVAAVAGQPSLLFATYRQGSFLIWNFQHLQLLFACTGDACSIRQPQPRGVQPRLWDRRHECCTTFAVEHAFGGSRNPASFSLRRLSQQGSGWAVSQSYPLPDVLYVDIAFENGAAISASGFLVVWNVQKGAILLVLPLNQLGTANAVFMLSDSTLLVLCDTRSVLISF